MSDLTISLIQANLIWEDRDSNLAAFERKISQVDRTADLILLPEMFNTGFSMKADRFFEEMDGKSVKWLHRMAEQTKAVICATLIIRENGQYYNRLVWMRPDGHVETYDKRHLFRLAEEHKTYTAGTDTKTVTLKDWRIRLNTCYDLRFPVWSRNDSNYDLIIYLANWPERRIEAWKTLLKARAIENLAYAIGVNRVGNDGNGIYHSGDSAVIEPSGDIIKAVSHEEKTVTIKLKKEVLETYREKLPFHLDADLFTIILNDSN